MNKMTRETVRRFLRGIIVMIVMLGGVRGSKGVGSGEEKTSIISDGFKVVLGGIAVYVANSVRDITFIKIDEEREGDKEEEKKTKLEVAQYFNTHFAGDFSRKWEYLKESFVINDNEDTLSVAGSVVLNSKRTTISDLSKDNAKESSVAKEDVEDNNVEDSDVEDNDVEILSNVDIDNLPEENEVQQDIKERLKALTVGLPVLKENVNVDIDINQSEDTQRLLETLNHSFVGKKINKEKMLELKIEMVQKEIEEEVKKRQKIEDTVEFYKAPSFIKDRDKALERAEELRQARKDLKEKIEKINDLIEYFDDLKKELKEIQEKKKCNDK